MTKPHIHTVMRQQKFSISRRRKTILGQRTLRLLLFPALLMFAALPALACNNVQFRNLDSNIDWQGATGVGYEIFDAAQTVQSITFDVRKTGPSGCDYFVGISVGGSGSYSRQLAGGGDTLDYNLYTTASRANVIKDVPTATVNEIISGSLPGSGTQSNSHTIYFYIAPQQIVSPAQYTDSIQFKVYSGDLSSYSLEQTKNVTMRAQVNQVAELSLVDTNQPFDALDTLQTLDFGTLVMDETASFDLRVRSNSGYDLTFQSQNSGELAINLAGDTSVVPYSLELNGSIVDLSSGSTVNAATGVGTTTSAGDQLPVIVTIGDLGNASAGNYSDNIAVVVTAK